MIVDPQVKKLYRSFVKDYLISRMYLEEDAQMISKQPDTMIKMFLELEKIKTHEELKNVIDNLRNSKIW